MSVYPVVLLAVDVVRVWDVAVKAVDLCAQVLTVEADTSEHSHEQDEDGDKEHQQGRGASSMASVKHCCGFSIDRRLTRRRLKRTTVSSEY